MFNQCIKKKEPLMLLLPLGCYLWWLVVSRWWYHQHSRKTFGNCMKITCVVLLQFACSNILTALSICSFWCTSSLSFNTFWIFSTLNITQKKKQRIVYEIQVKSKLVHKYALNQHRYFDSDTVPYS